MNMRIHTEKNLNNHGVGCEIGTEKEITVMNTITSGRGNRNIIMNIARIIPGMYRKAMSLQ